MIENMISLSESELYQAAKRYQFITEEQQEIWFQIEREIQKVLKPQYYYKKEENVVLLAFTLGNSLDLLIDKYNEEQELLKAYAADCLAMEILMKFYKTAQREIEQKEQCHLNKFLFPGDQLPLFRIKEILKQLSIKEITCNTSYMLLPKKTVVMEAIFAEESRTITNIICQNCTNINCVNKRVNCIDI